MKLRNLEIRLEPSYSVDNAGRYVAAVQFEDQSGQVKMLLAPDVAEAILAFLGPQLTKFSTQAAKKIEDSIMLSLAEAKQPQIAMESSIESSIESDSQ